MADLTEYEEKALEHASDMAGEYLEELGKTDLAEMSQEEWQQLIQVICVGYQMKRLELQPCPF